MPHGSTRDTQYISRTMPWVCRRRSLIIAPISYFSIPIFYTDTEHIVLTNKLASPALSRWPKQTTDFTQFNLKCLTTLIWLRLNGYLRTIFKHNNKSPLKSRSNFVKARLALLINMNGICIRLFLA